MPKITSLIGFTPGTKAKAEEINTNFATLRSGHNDQEARIEYLEANAIRSDGSIPMICDL